MIKDLVKVKKETGHVSYMATPSNTNESVPPLRLFIEHLQEF